MKKLKRRKTFKPDFDQSLITRMDLPLDFGRMLRRLASEDPENIPQRYVSWAQGILLAPPRKFIWPLTMTWLIKTLMKAYGDPVLILGMIGDITRIIRRRQQQKREGLNTTCIACGGWIPKDREERSQHTCSDSCQGWYRRLMRAIHAGKECRYCGHGLPKDRQKWPKQRRPGRPRGSRHRQETEPGKTHGSASRSTLKLVPVGKSVVLVNFIQDRSGSMSSVWAETVNGFRTFVKDLKTKAEGVEYLFSLTTFDTLVETPYVATPIADVDENLLADSQHGPRGCTALYDAVGTTIKNTQDNRHGADKIIVVIVTDGHENSSREWTKDALQKSVEACLVAGDWTFTYLGTQPETWDDAAAMGVSAGSVRSYSPTMAKAAYAATSHAVRSMACSASLGTRNLMDNHLPDSMMRHAGMDRKSTAPVVPVVTPQPTGGRPNVRWR